MHELSKQVTDYKSLRHSIAEIEERLTAVENEIKAHMGNNEEMIVDGNTVRWKKYAQTRFDTTAFKNGHAALYEQYLRRSESRRFTVT